MWKCGNEEMRKCGNVEMGRYTSSIRNIVSLSLCLGEINLRGYLWSRTVVGRVLLLLSGGGLVGGGTLLSKIPNCQYLLWAPEPGGTLLSFDFECVWWFWSARRWGQEGCSAGRAEGSAQS